MRVVRDEAWQSYFDAPDADWFRGARVKEHRSTTLQPGGRVDLALFEEAIDGGRPHPRLRVTLLDAEDPADAEPALPTEADLVDVATFRAWLSETLTDLEDHLNGKDLDPSGQESPHWFVLSITARRKRHAITTIRAALPPDPAFHLALAEAGDELFAGPAPFDDGDTGTYHSFGKDAPFVHWLEDVVAALPKEDTGAFALLPTEQQEAIRRQRDQARQWLDTLMRHKYAYTGIRETDIEKSLGGFLIDRTTRHRASETPESKDSLVPAFELLRVDPRSEHPHAGAWVYRDGDVLRLDEDDDDREEGAVLEVPDAQLRRIRVDASGLTFERAPGHALLRDGVRFDWDGNGFVQPDPIGWISWAGHCDIKAIMEALGLVLLDAQPLTEWRSDAETTLTLDRKLQIELLAAVLELGSQYDRLDGSGTVVRGIHRFGGARNDARPDRLQFQGPGRGRHFRWPLGGRQGDFRVTGVDGDEALDIQTAFSRYLPDLEALDFADNPAFLKTVEGDYNLIDLTGRKATVSAKVDVVDPATGYLSKAREELTIDLRADAGEERQRLGTHVHDPATRAIFDVFIDPAVPEMVAELSTWEQGEDGTYAPRRLPEEDVHLPLVSPLSATVSREMKRDDPGLFQALLAQALRRGHNICADTDMRSEVWNGVVTRIDTTFVKRNGDTRVEHWKVAIKARFGSATLDYLVRRSEDGTPVAWCPATGEDGGVGAPDFLWQDVPDVGSKGIEDGDWVVNATMRERGIVTLRQARWEEGGIYVHDDHVKNAFELLYCALSGHRWTLVHNNKRYGYTDREAWLADRANLQELRAALTFEDEESA